MQSLLSFRVGRYRSNGERLCRFMAESSYSENNAPAYDPISIDNSGLNIGQQGGQVNMHNVVVDTERLGTDSGPALRINRAAANIDVITSGNHSGIVWNGNNNGDYPSSLSHAQLSGTTLL